MELGQAPALCAGVSGSAWHQQSPICAQRLLFLLLGQEGGTGLWAVGRRRKARGMGKRGKGLQGRGQGGRVRYGLHHLQPRKRAPKVGGLFEQFEVT
jgi:hypothetical protein